MIAHYLKAALRNLLKYKVHSFISVICLSVGITCFSLMNYFIDAVSNGGEDLPNYEHRINLILSTEQTAADVYWYKDDITYLESQSIAGMDTIVASSFAENAEITVIDKDQQELPYLIKYKCASPTFFIYNNIRLSTDNLRLKAPDEVIISQKFAQKVFGKEDPTGMIIHLVTENKYLSNQIKDYKIIGVAMDDKVQTGQTVDCYFTLSMNPYLPLSVGSYLTGKTTLENLHKQLEKITWKRKDMTIHAEPYLNAERDNKVQKTIATLLGRFIASLILLSGLINFLKFVIQMFYNRQRELALRKCLGSDIKGLFSLLFAEIFWMMSVSFFLSLVVTEIIVSLAYAYIPKEDMISLPLMEIYSSQFCIYLILLLISFAIIIYPIYQLRKLTIINYIIQRQKRHVFRNIMIGIQLTISIFFVGGVYGMTLSFDEILGKMYSPLSLDEEKQIISLSVNSIRMQQNMDAILSDINSMPGIVDQTSISQVFDMSSFTYMSYDKDGRSVGMVTMIQGSPHYFDFFHIPMEGKMVDPNAQNIVYVSKQFKEQLQKDSIEGSVKLSGRDYQIAGTFEALNKEGAQRDVSGSVLLVSPQASTYYFKVSDSSDAVEMVKKITDICRRYVPHTLPLDIRNTSDSKQTVIGTIEMIRNVSMLLALISLLLVVLSIYSAISMDTTNRQKEVAIRKINGATPKIIALLFGKAYLIIYLSTFIVIYPLLRLIMIKITEKALIECVYRWDWGIQLFIAMAFLLFLITAYKIYEIMHINPASILKKE